MHRIRTASLVDRYLTYYTRGPSSAEVALRNARTRALLSGPREPGEPGWANAWLWSWSIGRACPFILAPWLPGSLDGCPGWEPVVPVEVPGLDGSVRRLSLLHPSLPTPPVGTSQDQVATLTIQDVRFASSSRSRDWLDLCPSRPSQPASQPCYRRDDLTRRDEAAESPKGKARKGSQWAPGISDEIQRRTGEAPYRSILIHDRPSLESPSVSRSRDGAPRPPAHPRRASPPTPIQAHVPVHGSQHHDGHSHTAFYTHSLSFYTSRRATCTCRRRRYIDRYPSMDASHLAQLHAVLSYGTHSVPDPDPYWPMNLTRAYMETCHQPSLPACLLCTYTHDVQVIVFYSPPVPSHHPVPAVPKYQPHISRLVRSLSHPIVPILSTLLLLFLLHHHHHHYHYYYYHHHPPSSPISHSSNHPSRPPPPSIHPCLSPEVGPVQPRGPSEVPPYMSSRAGPCLLFVHA